MLTEQPGKTPMCAPDLVEVLNELLQTRPAAPDLQTTPAENRCLRCILLRNLRKHHQMLDHIRSVLEEKTQQDSLRGFDSLSVLDTDSPHTASVLVTFRSPGDVSAYTSALHAAKHLSIPQMELSIENYDAAFHLHQVPGSEAASSRPVIGPTASDRSDSHRHLGPGEPHLPTDHLATYDAIVIENLNQLLPLPSTVEDLRGLFSTFALFSDIDTIFVPVHDKGGSTIDVHKSAFIGFSHNETVLGNVLRCLYHLCRLTSRELREFSASHISDDLLVPISAESPADHEEARLVLTLCQKKHKLYLYEHAASSFVASQNGNIDDIQVFDGGSNREFFEHSILPRFRKEINYQETNVYVNNFPILFQNDDDTWLRFWAQYGQDGINSAKIIKPQFYSKKADSSFGTFGFVFYKDVHMAIRAILATNNKIIKHGDGPSLKIQSSFAIQKKGHTAKKPLPLRLYSNSYCPEYNSSLEFPIGYSNMRPYDSCAASSRHAPGGFSPPPIPGHFLNSPLVPFTDMNLYCVPMTPLLPQYDALVSGKTSSRSASPDQDFEGPYQAHPMMNPYPPYGFYYYQYPMNHPLRGLRENLL